MEKIELSIVVPAKDEALGIAAVVDDLRSIVQLDPSIELIFVDDASTDGTHAAMCRARDILGGNVVVTRRSQSMGMGAAIAHGLRLTSGTYVSWIPGDSQYLGSDLIAEFRQSRAGESILFRRNFSLARPGARQWITRFMRLLIKIKLNTDLKDYSGIFIAPRSVLQSNIPKEQSVIFTACVARIIESTGNYSWRELNLRPRQHGRSKVLGLHNLLRNLFEILRAKR
jgi:glycosyltransferase involved in cell wall biosynthesis